MDQLGFSINEVSKTPTRRNILSIIASVYDPLGMVAPYILKAKEILQTLCQRKVGWDEEIPQDQKQEWDIWLQDFPRLREVKIDRCFKAASVLQPYQVQLHHFADASERGYGTVSYLRYKNGTQVHCAFVLAKARVAPLKKVSVPRLELTAATVMVKVNNMLHKELQMHEDETYFWTDSQAVLHYINNESSRYKTFVANRVELIRDSSKPSQWQYVPTEMNPADDCSRGLTMEKLLNKQQWFHGPDFLWKESSEWPTWSISQNKGLNGDDPEVKGSVSHTSCVTSLEVHVQTPNESRNEARKPQVEEDCINTLINHYSDWTNLRRGIAWWLRLKRTLLRRTRKQETPKDKDKPQGLTVEEIQMAEKAVISYVQQQSFSKEFDILERKVDEKQDDPTQEEDDKSKKHVSVSSTIANLDPELSEGMLRVGGRLRNANIPLNAKHQLILPKDHHVSSLIIRHVHQRVNHQGCNHILAELRQKYWIIRARTAVRSVIGRCVICKKRQAGFGTQKMADLPACRVKPDEPAFVRTGMDYFGPFEVKQGRVTRKKYGVIFTCLNCRAIHIEVAATMDTSSCIDAIRRFVARRGNVKEIYSDNGTNLVGANSELRRSLEELDQDQILNFSTNQGIRWHFNPPAASHHGGVWERQIRTVRRILCAILAEQHMRTSRTDEQLHTLMCEVEATVNSRPLTRASDNPDDLDVITPQHLLLLQPTAAFPPGKFNDRDVYARRRWRQMQFLADLFWKRWIKEYLPELQRRQKWLHPKRNLQEGDIVLIADNQAPRNCWAMGLVKETHVDKGGLVRSAKIKTKTAVLTRPISKLCLLLENDN
jgi:hypothetical protein